MVFGMEAVALYTFRATEGDELSFNKGDMLKVRSYLSILLSEESDLSFILDFGNFFFFLKQKQISIFIRRREH